MNNTPHVPKTFKPSERKLIAQRVVSFYIWRDLLDSLDNVIEKLSNVRNSHLVEGLVNIRVQPEASCSYMEEYESFDELEIYGDREETDDEYNMRLAYEKRAHEKALVLQAEEDARKTQNLVKDKAKLEKELATINKRLGAK